MATIVFSSLALKGVLEKFRAEFERAAGALDLRFDATQAILKQLEAGERADLLILTDEALRELHAAGKVTAATPLGNSGIGVAVKSGAPKPRIGTVEEFRRALESAESVAQSKVGASGLYFSSLVEKHGIRLRRRVVVEKGPVGLAVARGEAELGVQQLCELAPVPGIEVVGPFPAPLQVMTLFSAGIPANAAHPATARTLLALLQAPAARQAMASGGLEPA